MRVTLCTLAVLCTVGYVLADPVIVSPTVPPPNPVMPGHGCGNTLYIDVPREGTNETGASVPPIHAVPETWYYWSFGAKSTYSCLNYQLVAVGGDAHIVNCARNTCPDSTDCYGDSVMTAQADNPLNITTSKQTRVKAGAAFWGIYVDSVTNNNTVLTFDNIQQFECMAPGTIVPTKTQYTGTSGGVAALLFFIGVGIGVGGIMGWNYYRSKHM